MKNRSLLLSLAVASCLTAAGAAAEDPAAPDTSAWKCSKCEFQGEGYQSDVELGGGYLDDSSAKFGDYTGLTDKGGYVVADAEGEYTSESGYGLAYQMTDLGLDSRAIDVEGGKQGAYEFGLFYDRVPVSIWDTTETPFEHVGSRSLVLPSDWAYGGSTSGMTTLDENLHPVDVGYDRDRYGIGGKYFLGQNLVFALDFKRDDRSGFRSQFGSFGSTSTQLLAPIDDSTDRITASVRYQAAGWFVEVGYNGSFYSNNASSFDWMNPFTPIVPGADGGGWRLHRTTATTRSRYPRACTACRGTRPSRCRPQRARVRRMRIPALYDQPRHRDPAAADVEPARLRGRDARRPQYHLASLVGPSPAWRGHL